jgi:site-specific recombinase XerD
MKSAPTSGGESTAASDIPANAQSFARHLRAANKSPNTIKAYLDAVARLDGFLEGRGMPRAVAAIHREHVEAFVEDQVARLKPASARTATARSSSSSSGSSRRARSASRPWPG